MIKKFCDICGKECESLSRIVYLCHIDDLLNHNANVYVDNDGNLISGREVTTEACHRCYNEIMVKTVKSIRARQAEFANRA